MKTFNRPITLTFALITALSLAGCSSSGQDSARSSMHAETVASSSGANFSRSNTVDETESEGARYLDGRKLKRNAWLNLEVDDEEDIPETLDAAKKAAQAIGGYVQQETSHWVNFMVPTERTDSILDELANLGEVTERNVNVVDVTSQYVDLEIRIDNLERTRQRLQQLLTQSVDVQDVLEVEKELSRVTVELERLKGQMRTMQRETTYASVRLTVEEEVTPGPIGWVFYGGFKAVKWLFVWD